MRLVDSYRFAQCVCLSVIQSATDEMLLRCRMMYTIIFFLHIVPQTMGETRYVFCEDLVWSELGLVRPGTFYVIMLLACPSSTLVLWKGPLTKPERHRKMK